MLVFSKLAAVLLSVNQKRLKSTDVKYCYNAVISELFCGTLEFYKWFSGVIWVSCVKSQYICHWHAKTWIVIPPFMHSSF
jgi:hypothetical protein